MPTAARHTLIRVAAVAAILFAVGVAHAVDAGKPMPEIGVEDLSGKRIDLASLAGKVVVVDFWATWCGPCKDELPVLEALQRKYRKQGLVVIAVSVDSDVSKVRAFVKKFGLSLRVIHDADHVLAERYNPTKMPSSYIVDRKGKIRHTHAGFRKSDAKKIEAQIRALL